MGYPRFDSPFKLYTNASNFALGAVLSQTQDGVERVIAYAGRSLSPPERNLGITEKECLALVFAVKKFDCYLRNVHFDAYVDHSALKWLLSMKEPTGKFARWVALLQSYTFEIKYRPGKVYSNADAISRREYEQSNHCDFDELPSSVEIFESKSARSCLTLPTDDTPVPRIVKHPKCFKITASMEQSTESLVHTSEKLWSRSNLEKAQREDAWYKHLISYFETGDLPDDQNIRRDVLLLQSSYFLKDNILFHTQTQDHRKVRRDDLKIQVCVPRSLVSVVLKETHNSLLSGGHMGINRTLVKTRMKFFWPTLNSDVVRWVQACTECSQRKRPQKLTKAKVQSMPIPEQPFQAVSTDILGPFKPSKQTGNKYVLVFICYLTKYVELIPLSDIKAVTVANAFINNVICRHGTCDFLHSDRGTNYLSHIVRETCNLLNIKKTQTTSFHPQCNGQSERMMANITNQLAKHVDDSEESWDTFIPYIQFSYNTSPCLDSTQYTPFFLLHRRHPKSFLDLDIENFELPTNGREYIIHTLERLEAARAIARETLITRKEQMRQKADKSAAPIDFNLGDIVLVYIYRPVVTPGTNRKLNRPWVGPFYIAEKLSDIHVRVRRRTDGKLIRNRVHVNRLKRGYIWNGHPDNTDPPRDIDAVEPAILGDNVPEANFACPSDNGDDSTRNVDQNQNGNGQNDGDEYEIEKILRKKYVNDKWHYRVKWHGYNSSENSWVSYDNLNEKCQDYVKKFHKKIPTDRNSKRK